MLFFYFYNYRLHMKVLYRIFLIVLFVGGLNWALVAWLDLNLVAKLFPDVVTTAADGTSVTTMNVIAKVVYSLVGVGALWVLLANIFGCKCCKAHQPTV
jgi:uncharacterized membrane protein YuzA (DUF378 family)